jgi:spore maturation protein CgeB
MLILYVVMKYDYGQPERGYSYEHYNFFDTLVHMGHDIVYFDFMTLMQKYGKARMNRRLLEVANAEKPALMFTELFSDELEPKTVSTISDGNTITLNWFADDHWRFDDFSRHWAKRFNWVVTTAASAAPKYARIGCQQVIKSQWACNHFLYRRLDLPIRYTVTFVGQPHGDRPQIIKAVRDAGIDVNVWGTGWEAGRLTQEEMVRVFNQSRINLNLSNASMGSVQMPMYQAAYHRFSRSMNAIPLVPGVKRTVKSWLGMNGPALPTQNLTYSQQIKGRNFEVPGCGGALLTGRADNLEDYYEIGKEVACFDDTADLIEKIRYYLQHDDERSALAEAGYRRTLQEHTYVHRFTEIFQQIGLEPSGNGSGQVQEIT